MTLGTTLLAGCASLLTDSDKEFQKNQFIVEFSRDFRNKLVYPPRLGAFGIEGQVTVLFTFSNQGELTRCEILNTGSPDDDLANLKKLFGQSVIDACKVGGFPVAPLFMAWDEGFQARKTFYFRARAPEEDTFEPSYSTEFSK